VLEADPETKSPTSNEELDPWDRLCITPGWVRTLTLWEELSTCVDIPDNFTLPSFVTFSVILFTCPGVNEFCSDLYTNVGAAVDEATNNPSDWEADC